MAQLAGNQASTKKLEEKLKIQEYIQRKTIPFLTKKLLGDQLFNCSNEANKEATLMQIFQPNKCIKKQRVTLSNEDKQ
jgi:hypothetical protein